MKILAIETSCDETAAAVLEDERVLSSVISSQIDLHKKWGGVVPEIAKRAHEQRIEPVIAEALMRAAKIPRTKSLSASPLLPFPPEADRPLAETREINKIDIIAVTKGPGLAVALGVGIEMAKKLAIKYDKKLVAVNHIEGHIMSNWIKNRKGKPEREIQFPALNLSASGGHTKIILIRQQNPPTLRVPPPLTRRALNPYFIYQVAGETLDDAAGEALDKAAKLLGMGYPGGPIIERLSEKGDKDWLKLPRPLRGQDNFDYSFSGLKTSFYYQIRDWPKEKINKNLFNLAASFQEAVFDTLILKFRKAAEFYKPKTLLATGGVMANQALRKKLRKMAKELGLAIFMPVKKEWNTDNAAMIGVAGYYKAMRGEFVEEIDKLDREARWEIGN